MTTKSFEDVELYANGCLITEPGNSPPVNACFPGNIGNPEAALIHKPREVAFDHYLTWLFLLVSRAEHGLLDCALQQSIKQLTVRPDISYWFLATHTSTLSVRWLHSTSIQSTTNDSIRKAINLSSITPTLPVSAWVNYTAAKTYMYILATYTCRVFKQKELSYEQKKRIGQFDGIPCFDTG